MRNIKKKMISKMPLHIKVTLGNFTRFLKNIPSLEDRSKYIKDLLVYLKLNKKETFGVSLTSLYPCYKDWKTEAGDLNLYFWQDLWAAKRIYTNGAKEHCDIGSRVDGFIGHLLAANISVTLLDIRPMECNIENLHFTQADATDLKNIADNSVKSLSSLCAIEHFGLGRYGDMIDPGACDKVFSAIERVLKIGGRLYMSVPIGKEHVEFNAHRVFEANTIVKALPNLRLVEFSAISGGDKEIEVDIDIHKYDYDEAKGGGRFGLFIFEK